MFAVVVALVATIVLTPETVAQTDTKYTVWSSVIFSRTGERTPSVLGSLPVTLTSLGAQQQYSNGAYFRERYLTSYGSTSGIGSAPISGLEPSIINPMQVYVEALDEQFSVASAQAFVQGLYPPFNLTTNNTGLASLLDPTSLEANGTYVVGPMGGYQYAQIHATNIDDAEFPYLGGNFYCPAWDYAAIDTALTPTYAAAQAESSSVYKSIGPVFLSDVLNPEQWNYYNAYPIYDYINYQNTHNVTAASLLSGPQYINPGTNISYLDTLRWYSDQQQYAWLGDLYATNNLTASPWPTGITGSISTLPGNLLAAKMLAQLQMAIESAGTYYKLSLLFADYQPLVSFFALTSLPPLNSNFYGLPDFGSVALFELFSYTTNSSSGTFPSEDELWVRFYFRNGTGNTGDADEEFLAYPMFDNGPDSTDMMWTDFQAAMYDIAVGDVGTWCQQCGAENIFCAVWNSSLTNFASGSSSDDSKHAVSPVVGGVIGAIVALVIAGMLFGAMMLIGGIRFHRLKSHKGELGGFKGSQKLASDKDLTIPKGGAVVGASVETPGSPVRGGHERVGSWELKQNDLPNIAAPAAPRRPSFEDDDIGDLGASPFREPVKADERV